jgi:hypothetical protein
VAPAIISDIDILSLVHYLYNDDNRPRQFDHFPPSRARLQTDRKRISNGFQTDISAEISHANASNGFVFLFFWFERAKAVAARRLSGCFGLAEP